MIARTITTRRLVTHFDKIELVCDNLSMRRIRTWLITELTYVFKWDRVRTLPTHLQIEPTNKCNLRCPVCHVVTDTKPQGRIRFDDFCKIIDEVGDYLLVLNLWGWGEPFLNPDIFAMIRYAKARGIKVVTSTNGHFLDNTEHVDQLLDAAPDILFVALDGVDKATYEKYRQNGNWERVLAGLRLLLRRREERGLKFPRINLRMLLTKDTESQVPAMQTLAQKIGVDVVSFKTLNSFDNPVCGETLIPNDQAYRRFMYDNAGMPIRVENRCRKLWNHPTIYHDGTLVLCDYYTGDEFALGNVLKDRTFSQFWFGEEYRQVRKRFAMDKRAGLRCDNCSLNYADLGRSIPLVYRYR
jgi:radical SAM protein with 4Fe4S-binding SPASM domain